MLKNLTKTDQACLGILVCLLGFFSTVPAFAGAVLPRDEIIKKEFDCIQDHKNTKQKVDWAEVCYSGLNRNNIVDQALDEAAANLGQYAQGITEVQHYAAAEPAPGPRTRPVTARASADGLAVESEAPAPRRKERAYSEYSGYPAPLEIKQHQVEFGTEVSHISYKEPSFNLEEKGMMYGVYGSYAYRMDDEEDLGFANMYKLEGKVSTGSVDYASDPSGTVDDINDFMAEFRLLLGYDSRISSESLITPYAGLGFRYLNDDLGGKQTTTGAAGYERASHYVYIPFGIDFSHQVTAGWLFNINGEVDLLVYGLQQSYLSDVDSTYPDLENDQKRGFGLRGSFELIKKGDVINLSITPFIRYWHVKNSAVTTAVGYSGLAIAGLEPDNNSTEMGVKLGVQF